MPKAPQKPPSPPATPLRGFLFGHDRAKSFSDGVFSIVITLLVLELKVPHLDQPADAAELFWSLLDLWPKFLSYFISFFLVGIYWVAHHNFFHNIHRVDRPLLWLNNFFLLGVIFLPFPAAMLGEYNTNPLALGLYGLNLVYIGSTLYGMWSYACTHPHLMGDHVRPGTLKAVRFIILVPVALYCAAGLMAWASPKISLLIYLIVPVLYILPGALEALVAKIESKYF